MTVHHKTKSIFIHVPKTAGKTVRKYLQFPQASPTRIFHARPSYDEVNKYWNEYFCFTFVRNPLDRAVSAFFFDHKRYKNGMHKTISGIRNHVVKYPKTMDGFSEFFINLCEKNFLNDYKFIPQMSIIERKDFDFIGKFENLAEDLKLVYEKIYKKSSPKQIPHINASRKSGDNYKKYYTKQALIVAKQYYDVDFVELGYNINQMGA